MVDNISKADKQHQQYLDEHDRLTSLFVTDRFAFELERKRILDEAIDSMYTREKRKAQQKEWDRILKGIGSAENRFAMAQALLWHHMVNIWQPDLQEYSTALNVLVKGLCNRPVFTLAKKLAVIS